MTYLQRFERGRDAGGWFGWISNAAGPARLQRDEDGGAVVSRGPWWVDYNHAPPGGGYLHLLFALQTRPHFELDRTIHEVAGANRFVQGGFPTDFSDARVTLRLRGDVELRGARMVLHAQAKVGGAGGVYVNQTLVGQPFAVTPQWSEQTIRLAPEPAQWKSLGARHDRGDFYGHGDIDAVLRDLNGNIILILYPLNVVPAEPSALGAQNPHGLRAGEDYEVDRSLLPSGYIMMQQVRIDFPERASGARR